MILLHISPIDVLLAFDVAVFFIFIGILIKVFAKAK